MRDYRKSDYAINKYSPNIVYRFHDEIVEVSLEDYLKENPDKTEQDFAELKALSDEIYYEQDRAESAQTRKDVSIHGLEEMDCCSNPAIGRRIGGTGGRSTKPPLCPDCTGAAVCCGRTYRSPEAAFSASCVPWPVHPADRQAGGDKPSGGRQIPEPRYRKIKKFFCRAGLTPPRFQDDG